MTTHRVRLPETIRLQHPALPRTDIAQLAAIPVLFIIVIIAELLAMRAQQPLHWDETIYASQISQHAPMLWGPSRARGLPLLLAPVTLLTSSTTAMRVYMAVLAGTGLFLAALAWRRIRPAWMIVLGTAMFTGLGLTQIQAASLYPNYWSAVGALAIVGLSLRMARLPSARDAWLLLIAVAFTGLMRPTDVIFLSVPILVVMAVVLKQRARPILAAIGAGLVISIGEWLAESYMYFGGPARRLSASGKLIGTHLNLLNNLHILDGGPTVSLPGVSGSSGAWHHPYLLIWWVFFAALALLGVRAAYYRDGRPLARLPLICALSIYLLYSLVVSDDARYLLPVLALLAIPAAEGAGFFVRGRAGQRYSYAAMAGVAILVLAEFLSQALLINAGSAAATRGGPSAQNAIVRQLRNAGVKPPCVITSVPRPGFVGQSEPAAYYLNCSYRWNVRKISNLPGTLVILTKGKAQPWPYAAKWQQMAMPRHVIAHIGPLPKQHLSRGKHKVWDYRPPPHRKQTR